MSNDKMAVKQKVDALMGSIVSRKQTFQDLLPEGLKAEWFLGEVRVAVARVPKLAACTGVSVVDALTTCAQLGLSPSGRLGSAYLIPYGEKCTLVIGYRGYADLAYRSGEVASFHAKAVYEKDVFQYEEGISPVLRHVPSEDMQPGQLRAAYVIVKMKDGNVAWCVMNRREVLAIKGRSKSSTDGPWVTDEAEMWCKTVVRRVIKLLPLSPTKAKDLYAAEQAERDQEAAIEAEFTLADEPRATGVAGAKEATRKALDARRTLSPEEAAHLKATESERVAGASTKGVMVDGDYEPSAAEKAAILAQEQALSEPGSEG